MKAVFEHVSHPLSASFACSHFEGATFDCPYHVHPEIEILRIDASQGRFLAGDHVGRFGPGDGFLFGAGLPHMFCNDATREPSQTNAHSRYIQFRTDCFGGSFFSLPELQPVAQLLNRSARGLHFRMTEGSSLLAVSFDAIFATQDTPRLTHLLRLLDELTRFQPYRVLASDGFLPVTSTRSSERLERALTHINHGFVEGVDLPGTARAASMSPEAFSRFFRRHLGRTFQDYVTDLRIAEACRLLLDTDLSATEVCHRSGFNNLANFNRHFLRHKGRSPLKFRALGDHATSGQPE